MFEKKFNFVYASDDEHENVFLEVYHFDKLLFTIYYEYDDKDVLIDDAIIEFPIGPADVIVGEMKLSLLEEGFSVAKEKLHNDYSVIEESRAD